MAKCADHMHGGTGFFFYGGSRMETSSTGEDLWGTNSNGAIICIACSITLLLQVGGVCSL